MKTVIALLLILVAPAIADEAAFEFKGIKLGSTSAEILADKRYECKAIQDVIGDTECVTKALSIDTIAGVPAEYVLALLYEDHTWQIRSVAKSDAFSTIAAALQEKYGRGNVEHSTIQNRAGATFD
jgi:ADP-dependent phosphofructokinase/glucokinase